MCGIVGLVGEAEAAPRLLEGLRRLEYRGYDSAGIATLANGGIDVRRAEGKLQNLANLMTEQPLAGTTGIGHTRWATHGEPTQTNAHPHSTGRVAVVHNGIIENFSALRRALEGDGYEFSTDTDTEVIPRLIHKYLEDGLSPVEATATTLKQLEGAFALGVLFAGEHGLMIGARRGSPLAVGHGEGESFLASDAFAMAPFTRRICYLEEGDWAVLGPGSVEIFDAEDRPVERAESQTAYDGAVTGKGNHRHFMEKEIHEQPRVIGDTLNTYYNPAAGKVRLPGLPLDLATLDHVSIVACGTSFYAGMTARYWIEELAGVPAPVDIASEFRYREPPLGEHGAALFISQSGETADTLAALRFAKEAGQHTLSVVNVPESTMAREADAVMPTHAGVEIGVASTKAFTTQLVTLACFAISLARAHGRIDDAEEARLAHALAEVPARAVDVLAHDESLRALAGTMAEARTVLYLGRGAAYPIAMEGALKLKEISYIHAEGFAAGEMKHGPIALIEKDTPVIVVAPPGALFEKTASNLQEAAARGARVILLSDAAGIAAVGDLADATVELPLVDPFVAPILYTIPVQLLAYHTAVAKGTDVDQPRNLAKSVTVE